MDNEKLLKNSKWVAIIILVLVILLFIATIIGKQLTTTKLISFIIQIALLVATAVGMKQHSLYGPICGVIVSILLILSLDIFSLIIGICYLIDNINIIRHMKNN